jgi:hypothetical protein
MRRANRERLSSGSHLRPALARYARGSVDRLTKAGCEAYRRERHLPGLIPIEADRIAAPDLETHRSILAKLARALRAERNRGRAGHWTYDLNRHIGLLQAYAAERRLLSERTRRVTPR